MSLPYGLSPVSACTAAHPSATFPNQSQTHSHVRPGTATSYTCSTRSSSPVSIRSIQSINSILSQRRSRLFQRRRRSISNGSTAPRLSMMATTTRSSLLGRIYGESGNQEQEQEEEEEEDEAREVLGIMEPAPREMLMSTMAVGCASGGVGAGGMWGIGEVLEEGARINLR